MVKTITLEITEKDYENYKLYCKMFDTDNVEDLTAYLKARADEMERYMLKTGGTVHYRCIGVGKDEHSN